MRAARPVQVRFWSKWHRNIPYWVDSEVYAKYHDEPFAADGDIRRGIPLRTKLKTTLQHQFLSVYEQSDSYIYVIGSPLKYMPSPMTIRWTWTELQTREFPRGRNYKRTTNMSSRLVMVKVTTRYTLLGHLWSICQVPWRSHLPGRRYKQGNFLRCEIRNGRRTWVLGRLWSKWHRHIHYWFASEVYANSHDDPLAACRPTARGIPSDATTRANPEAEILHVSRQSDIEIYIIG